VTVPVGVPEAALTVAVNATAVPEDALEGALKVVVVAPSTEVIVIFTVGDVLPVKLFDPP
jgi:hypothetical protein